VGCCIEKPRDSFTAEKIGTLNLKSKNDITWLLNPLSEIDGMVANGYIQAKFYCSYRSNLVFSFALFVNEKLDIRL